MLKENVKAKVIVTTVKVGNYITTRICMEIQKLQMTGSGMMCRKGITSSARTQL